MRRLSWSGPRPALVPSLRRAAPWLLCIVAGALLFALFGTVPARLERPDASSGAWQLPQLPDRSAAAAEAATVWASRHPWGGAPVVEDEAAAQAAAAPVPVAIIGNPAGHIAVFVIPGSGEVRTRAGDTLPDGGRVEEVDVLSVTWTDGRGERQQQRLLADQPRSLGMTTPTTDTAPSESPRPRRSRRARNP